MKKPVCLCHIMGYDGLNVYVPPNSYVEALISNVIEFEDGAFGK